MSVIEHIVPKSGAESTLRCLGGTSVVLASSATMATPIVVISTSATAIASSTSSTHVLVQENESFVRENEREYADVMSTSQRKHDVNIGYLPFTDVTVSLVEMLCRRNGRSACVCRRYGRSFSVCRRYDRSLPFADVTVGLLASMPTLRSVSSPFYQLML